MKQLYVLVLYVCLVCQLPAQQVFKSQSQLRDGVFYKCKIEKTGVHKLTPDLLKKITNNAYSTTSNVQIYATVGQALEESTRTLPVDDLDEIPTILSSDGSLLFYVEGTITQSYDKEKDAYQMITNPYDRYNYVFVRVDGRSPKRVEKASQPSRTDYVSSAYDKVQKLDEDKINLLHSADNHFGSGREWFMDRLSKERSYLKSFDFSGLVEGSEYQVEARIAARCNSFDVFKLNIGEDAYNSTVGSVSFGSLNNRYATTSVIKGRGRLAKSPQRIQAYVENTSSACAAWLDYIQVVSRHKASFDGSHTTLSDRKSLQYNTASLEVGSTSSRIVEVSRIHAPQEHVVQNGKLHYAVEGRLKRFVAFSTGTAIPLSNGVKIKNQNLHQLNSTEMVVLYHRKFTDAATRLAKHRVDHDNLEVALVDVDQVYNEYSGGKVDPSAIRNFVRMLWSRDPSMHYLLLFGDATFDYRNIITSLSHDNYIPAYETQGGLHPISSFPSDDYYCGLVNDNGGLTMQQFQISVGRLPVTDINNAKALVDKIIHYDTSKKRYGKWRTHITMVADDEDGNAHVESAERMSKKLARANTLYNQSKIYFDAYKQESLPVGNRYNKASEDINAKVQNGQLAICYFGHGGPNGWAQERVLKKSDIDTWTNYDNMPVLITATCTFAGYDDPSKVSAGEYCLQKEDGGAIALFTTVRPVFINDNERLTKAVLDTLFGRNINGAIPLGNVMRYAKNKLKGSLNSKRFTLLGDPAQKLATPEYKVVIDKVNGVEITKQIDTLSAFDKGTIEGRIVDGNNVVKSSFNGTIDITVFDKEAQLTTLANDGGKTFDFKAYKNIIFRGSTRVIDGKYSISFVVPKDIDYTIGRGRISAYAYGTQDDAAGYSTQVYVGGTSDNPIVDNKGPEVKIYLDDRSFEDGQQVSRFPLLIADLADDVGVNVTGSSIGHDIVAVFDGDKSKPLILNEYYSAATGDYKKGSLSLPLHHLNSGKHTVTIRAWDTANNSGEGTVSFVIPDRDQAQVTVQAGPNPFVDNINLKIAQNMFLDYKAKLIMIDAQGRVVLSKVYDSVINNSIFISQDELSTLGKTKNVLMYKIILSNDQFNSGIESGWEKLLKL